MDKYYRFNRFLIDSLIISTRFLTVVEGIKYLKVTGNFSWKFIVHLWGFIFDRLLRTYDVVLFFGFFYFFFFLVYEGSAEERKCRASCVDVKVCSGGQQTEWTAIIRDVQRSSGLPVRVDEIFSASERLDLAACYHDSFTGVPNWSKSIRHVRTASVGRIFRMLL